MLIRRIWKRMMALAALATMVAVAGCGAAANDPAANDPAGGAPSAGTADASAGATADASPQRPTSLTVAAIGDLFVPPPLTRQAAADARAAGRSGHDFTQILAAIGPMVGDADLAICHLEQPLAQPDGPFPSFPFFAAPPSLADTTAELGFDTCSTASNHALDDGRAGIARTLRHLDRVGLAHTGTARTRAEANTLNIVDVRGVQVGHLSYTFSFNGIPLPAGAPWAANELKAKAVLAEARRARRAGAEVVIASLHWGTEYQVAADQGQLGLAERLLGSGEIDLILGHHAHVVQPFERVGKAWVAYGMGNLTTRFPDGSPENTQDAVVPTFTFTRPDTGSGSGRWRISEVEVVATWMEYRPAARVVNLPAALGDPDLGEARRNRYARILDRITGYVGQRGAFEDGLRMARPARSGS